MQSGQAIHSYSPFPTPHVIPHRLSTCAALRPFNKYDAPVAMQTNADLDWTVKEVVGNAKVDIEDMKYACAVVGAVHLHTWLPMGVVRVRRGGWMHAGGTLSTMWRAIFICMTLGGT